MRAAGAALNAERIKLTTLRSPLWAAVAAAVLALALAALQASVSSGYAPMPVQRAAMGVAVFGVPDDDLGQAVTAVLELTDGVPTGEAASTELLSWARERLARHKCPRTLAFETRLPRTDAGKLYKSELVRKYSAISAQPTSRVPRRPS